MRIIPITDPADPRVADYRNIPDPEMLRDRGLFVAENRMVVRILLASSRFRTRSVLVTEAAREALEDVLGGRELPPFPIYVCPKALMEPISGFHIHRGCLALAERPAPVGVESLLAALPDARRLVVLEAITNADNMGAIFRNVRAFGADAVIVGPRCCDPLYRKAVRVSIGATLTVPFATCEGVGTQLDDDETVTPFCNREIESRPHFIGDLRALKAAGFTLVALTPAPDAIDLAAFVSAGLPARIALVAGNEGEGLTAAARHAADVRVRIPMAPGADSINVSTATGIALHRIADRLR